MGECIREMIYIRKRIKTDKRVNEELIGNLIEHDGF
jgi:hypothetical protein